MKSASARRAAFEVLQRVEESVAFSSILLASLPKAMREDDRALCHELVLGVLRRRSWLDAVLAHFSNKPFETLDLAVKISLRLGVYQLRFLSRIPPSAAVNESVKLVREARLASAAAFVNAVLRRAAREAEYDPAASITDPLERLAIETSHPAWLLKRWIRSFGREHAIALARANNDPAPVAFRLTSKVDKRDLLAELSRAGVQVRPSQIAPQSWRAEGDHRALRRFAREGLIYFQDEASQLVAHLLDPKNDENILDICAGPGSKTTHVAALAPQATIIAGDLHPHRLRTLGELAFVQGCSSIYRVAYDAMYPLPLTRSSFDRVLVDAPCSGTGTLRHNPEIRWRITPEDIGRLSLVQRAILGNAAQQVRRGGLLIYSTCSVEKDEDEAVVESFLSTHHSFQQVSLDHQPDLSTANGAVRTWPQRQSTDGFFVAGFRRA